jgi:hypothetical protein
VLVTRILRAARRQAPYAVPRETLPQARVGVEQRHRAVGGGVEPVFGGAAAASGPVCPPGAPREEAQRARIRFALASAYRPSHAVKVIESNRFKVRIEALEESAHVPVEAQVEELDIHQAGEYLAPEDLDRQRLLSPLSAGRLHV